MRCINCNKELQQDEGYIHDIRDNMTKPIFDWVCSRKCEDQRYIKHNQGKDIDVLSIVKPFRIILYYGCYCYLYKQITHAYSDYTDKNEILIYTDTKDLKHMLILNRIEQAGKEFFPDIKWKVEYKYFREKLPVLNERGTRYQLYPPK